jgi:glutaconate CoA-transferase subunit A
MPEFVDLAAAADWIQDGMTVALGGMTLYRRPMSFIRALLRRPQPPRNLTLLCFTAGLESDLLIGAGCVKAVRTVYFGLESFGFAPMFSLAVQQGDVQVIEETEQSLAMGMRAHMSGVGFMPSRAWIGTDLPRLRPDVKTVVDPYSGDILTAFPAIHCDAAVLHALEADRNGNIRLNNNLGVDLELASISESVIVTVEQISDVPLARSVDGYLIPAPGINCIASAPRGARPTSCYPLYRLDGGEILRYVDACNSGQFSDYLRSFLSTG